MAAEGQVISCHSLDQWKEQIEKEKESKKLFFAKERSVEAMPTFIFLKEGNIVDRVVGAKKEDLHQTIVKHSTDMALTTASA